MATKKRKCLNFDPDTGKRRPDRPFCREPCLGIHPEEPGWRNAYVYQPRARDTTWDTFNVRPRRKDSQYEDDQEKGWHRLVSRPEPASIKGRDPPVSARVSRNDTTTTSSALTSRSSWTNQPHATTRVQSTSMANKTGVGWGSPPPDNTGRKNAGRSSPQANPQANDGGWGPPIRVNTGGWRSPVANHSARDAGWGSPVTNPTTLPAPQPSVAKPKPKPTLVPAPTEPFDELTAKPASSLPPKPSLSASNSYPNTSNLTEVNSKTAPTSRAVRKGSTSNPVPTPRERSAEFAISLPSGFITPSPAPSVPPTPRPPALRLVNRPTHSRRESLQTPSSATETAPPSAISVHSNYSGFTLPLVSASPRTAGFALGSPLSAVSAPASAGELRIAVTPEGTNVQGGAEKVPKDPAEVLWDENIEIMCRALTRRRELQAAMEQVKRRDQFYFTLRSRRSSCSVPPNFNSPNDPLNRQVQEAQERYEDVLTELSERKTSWWPTPTLVDPSEMLIDLDKRLEELEREIEEVTGVPIRSRAEDLAAATTKDNSMKSREAEAELNIISEATPARLTSADVVRALEDLENRVEEVEGGIDARLESGLRRKVRAYLRRRFPPAPRPAVTEKDRLKTTLLRAKQAENRVQGLESRLAGLTMVPKADQIQLVRERIKKRREATQELIKKEGSILDFLSRHNASLDIPEDKLKETLKTFAADNELISSISKPYCDRIQATIDGIGTATIPEDRQATLRKSRRDRASDEIYELVAGAPEMQQQLTMADWVQKNWGHIKRGESLGMGQQSVTMDVVMG